MENLKPDQIVWLKEVRGDDELQEAKIISVGRLYVVVSCRWRQIYFDKNTLKQKSTGRGYCYDWVLYLSKEVYQNEVLQRMLLKQVKSLDFEKLSIEKLQQIIQICKVE